MRKGEAKKILWASINQLEIPEKERVLSKEMLDFRSDVKKVYQKIWIKQMGMAVTVVFAFSCLVAVGVYLYTDKENPLGHPIDEVQKKVICAETADWNEASPETVLSRDEKYISRLLREKMLLYENEDVYFRVFIVLQGTEEDSDEYQYTEANRAELERLYQEEQSEWAKARELYESWKNLIKKDASDEETIPLKKQWSQQEKIAREASSKYFKLYMEDYEIYMRAILDEHVKSIYDLGIELVPFMPESETMSLGGYKGEYEYIAEVTAEEIEQLNGCWLFLAPGEGEEIIGAEYGQESFSAPE